MPKAAKYAWVTSEMYDAKLAEVLDDNDVLEALERERDKG